MPGMRKPLLPLQPIIRLGVRSRDGDGCHGAVGHNIQDDSIPRSGRERLHRLVTGGTEGGGSGVGGLTEWWRDGVSLEGAIEH